MTRGFPRKRLPRRPGLAFTGRYAPAVSSWSPSARGVERIERGEVPAAIASTQQFRSLCPKTAACFRRALDVAAVHFSRDVLMLRPDVAGATM